MNKPKSIKYKKCYHKWGYASISVLTPDTNYIRIIETCEKCGRKKVAISHVDDI